MGPSKDMKILYQICLSLLMHLKIYYGDNCSKGGYWGCVGKAPAWVFNRGFVMKNNNFISAKSTVLYSQL